MHIPYKTKLGHLADFRVRYRFYDAEEGARKTMPFQGYRSDFGYEHPDIVTSDSGPLRVFMIWPEFENTEGQVISDNTKPVEKTGTAGMWILNPDFRAFHSGRITAGMRGDFM
jgi:hypothetical protein